MLLHPLRQLTGPRHRQSANGTTKLPELVRHLMLRQVPHRPSLITALLPPLTLAIPKPMSQQPRMVVAKDPCRLHLPGSLLRVTNPRSPARLSWSLLPQSLGLFLLLTIRLTRTRAHRQTLSLPDLPLPQLHSRLRPLSSPPHQVLGLAHQLMFQQSPLGPVRLFSILPHSRPQPSSSLLHLRHLQLTLARHRTPMSHFGPTRLARRSHRRLSRHFSTVPSTKPP